MKEESLHKQICNYIKLQYPKVIFNTDLSGIKLTIGQAVKLKSLRSSRAFPDLFVYEPRGCFKGFFAEIKRDNPYKKDGKLKANDHLKEQAEMIFKLLERGYYGGFYWDFEQFKKSFDLYINVK